MARRRGTGRGSNVSKGVISGTTLATTPSGVTLDAGGIAYNATTKITPTEVGYMDGCATRAVSHIRSGFIFESGVTDWQAAGGSVSSELTIKFTNISTGVWFMPIPYSDSPPASGIAYPLWEWMKGGTDASGVSVFVNSVTGVPSVRARSGSSIRWLAFGQQ